MKDLSRFFDQYKLIMAEGEGGNVGSGAGDQATIGDADTPQGDGDTGAILEIDGQQFRQDDVLRWKEDSDNKTNWQKEYTQRDQKLAEIRKSIEGQRTPVTQEGQRTTTQVQGIPKLTGAKIKEALGEDGDNFEGLANVMNEYGQAIREDAVKSIMSQSTQDAMVKDFIGRHPQWNEYTADGGKVTEYLRTMPGGYPTEVAFLELRLKETEENLSNLVKEAEKKGFKLGEQTATKQMGTKTNQLRMLRGEPPVGKKTETPLTQSDKDKAMIETLEKMRKGE